MAKAERGHVPLQNTLPQSSPSCQHEAHSRHGRALPAPAPSSSQAKPDKAESAAAGGKQSSHRCSEEPRGSPNLGEGTLLPLSPARQGRAEPRSSTARQAGAGRERRAALRYLPAYRRQGSRAGLPPTASARRGRALPAPPPRETPPLPPRHLPGAAMVRGWRGRGRCPPLTSPAPPPSRGRFLAPGRALRPAARPRPARPARPRRAARGAPCGTGHRAAPARPLHRLPGTRRDSPAIGGKCPFPAGSSHMFHRWARKQRYNEGMSCVTVITSTSLLGRNLEQWL